MDPLLNITKVDEGERLDVVLARTYPDYSRTFFQKLVREGGVTREDRPSAAASGRRMDVSPRYRVQAGERFSIVEFQSPTFHLEQATKTPRPAAAVTRKPEVIYEDASLLVIDKPAGLVVHPAPGYRSGTLIDWLRGHLGAAVKVFTDPERLGLVHRLDKDTSGVLLIAKTILAQTAISRQFQDRTVKKTYVAFVEGIPSSTHGVISAPVGRSRKVPTRMAVSSTGKASETSFEVKQALGDVSQLELRPKTGRTHQIRVHLAALGHPIVGDRTYGSKATWLQTHGIGRPLLHAEKLEIRHPDTGKMISFKAPWPKDFRRAEKLFQKAVKSVAAAVLVACLVGGVVRADDDTTHAATPAASAAASSATPKSTSTSSHPNPARLNSRITALTSEIKDLQKQNKDLQSAVKDLRAETAHLKDQTTALQSDLDGLGASGRLRDLEHAVAELNAKSVGGSTSGEEIKTQLMDLSRKIKDQQDSIEQLRDQVDRVQRQVITQKTKGDETPPPAAPDVSGSGK